jgi:putative ABC transport system permease protein
MTRDLLKEAFNAMQHNRRRTALTMLGMAWGIATVVILLAFRVLSEPSASSSAPGEPT